MRTKPTSAKQRCWRVAAAQPLILPSSVIGSQACLNARAASPARVSDLCSTERPNHCKQRWLPAEGISPGQTGARDVRRTCPRNSRVQWRGEISGTVPGPHLVNPCSLPTSFSCSLLVSCPNAGRCLRGWRHPRVECLAGSGLAARAPAKHWAATLQSTARRAASCSQDIPVCGLGQAPGEGAVVRAGAGGAARAGNAWCCMPDRHKPEGGLGCDAGKQEANPVPVQARGHEAVAPLGTPRESAWLQLWCLRRADCPAK